MPNPFKPEPLNSFNNAKISVTPWLCFSSFYHTWISFRFICKHINKNKVFFLLKKHFSLFALIQLCLMPIIILFFSSFYVEKDKPLSLFISAVVIIVVEIGVFKFCLIDFKPQFRGLLLELFKNSDIKNQFINTHEKKYITRKIIKDKKVDLTEISSTKKEIINKKRL